MNTDDSIRRQDAANSRYKAAYKEWQDSLSPEERKRLTALGLDKPEVSYTVGGHSPESTGDIADSPTAVATAPDPSEIPDAADPTPATAADTLTSSEAISRIVALLIGSPNVRLESYALAFAANLNALNGLGTQGECAKALGVSATILSRRIEAVRALLHLPTSRHQKSDKARQSARAALRRDHWRNRTTATHLGQTPSKA